ncbi:uncharacterized protein LOC143284839 [Babylonia areolata]|uniref:uncharacterized protein LOC143284839 n=1 Tax=Babylonia areolata TaxID=304850 RepID=UPI003FD2CA71
MGFKMAPSESAKVALGVLALAGIGLVLYVISKQLGKKNKRQEKTRSEVHGDTARGTEKGRSVVDRDSTPAQGREADDEATKDEPPTMASGASAGRQEGRGDHGSRPTSESVTLASTETSSISASMSGWEEVKPMDTSFTEVKSSTPQTCAGMETGAAGEMSAASQTGSVLLGSFTEVSHTEGCDPESKGAPATEAGMGGAGLCQCEEGDVTLPPAHKDKASADDVQSLQSEDTSSGEAPSFEQLNGSDDGTSLGEANNTEGGASLLDFSFVHQQQQPPPLPESLQSFEKISMSSSGLKTSTNEDRLSSFGQAKEASAVESMKSFDSSIVVIPESLDGSLPSQQATQGAGESEEGKEKEAEETQEQTAREPVKEQMKAESSEKTEQSAGSRSESEEKVPSTPEPEETRTKTPQQREAEGSGSLPSFEVISERGLAEAKEYYSSDSLQSFSTAVSGSGSSKQDFYSPVSSPPTVDSSLDNTSFRSFDDSEASEEMTFHDVEASGRLTPQSPQDRTPTNTPVPAELGGGDAELTKTPVEETPGGMAESSDAEEDPVKQTAAEEERPKDTDPSVSSEADRSESKTSTEAEGSGSGGMLALDKDKVTAAILQAQNGPDKLEIGHIQILVELLKGQDWTLLNTTLQCLLRATAFTINVEVIRTVGGPSELSRLVQKLAAQLLGGRGGSKVRGQGEGQGLVVGGPGVEALFLNCVRVVNNLAMDIKSQPQLEGSLPALTDLLMTEGISETVTLACLQPLTNVATTPTYHGHYTRLLQQLYCFLDTSQSTPLRLQCLKLLVNLSLNADMVPHMLAAKAPSCLLDLLDVNYNADLLLRTVTFLANVMAIMEERGLTPSTLPPDEKAPSPETLLSALVAHGSREVLRNKVYRLTRHDSEDVCYQASRLYKYVSSK